jgi:NADPH-dependent curcumin reductase CurA
LRLTVRGFIVSDEDFGPKYKEEFTRNVSKWLNEGSVRAKLHETVGIENAAEGFVGLLQGENFGKAILKIKV